MTHFRIIKCCPHRVSHIWVGPMTKRMRQLIHSSPVRGCCATRGKSKDMASISFPLNQADVGCLLRAPFSLLRSLSSFLDFPFTRSASSGKLGSDWRPALSSKKAVKLCLVRLLIYFVCFRWYLHLPNYFIVCPFCWMDVL